MTPKVKHPPHSKVLSYAITDTNKLWVEVLVRDEAVGVERESA